MRCAPVLLVLCVATPAFAQDEFRPAVDSRGYLTLNGSQVLDRGELSFGLGSLAWGRHPETSIDHVVTATLVWAVGLRLGLPVELGASLPFTIEKGVTTSQGVGNPGIHAKVQLVRGVALVGSMYMPTGSLGRTTQVSAVGDLAFGRVRLAINAGVRTTTMTTDVPVGAALAYALAPERFEIVGEVFGTPHGPIESPPCHGCEQFGLRAEVLAGVKLYLAKNSYLSLGAGRGFTEGSPDLRAFIGIVFEPKPAERHAAVVPDEPMHEPPPPPPAPDPDPVPPDTSPVIDAGSVIELLENVEFEFDKAVLRPSASRILDAVVRMMRDNPSIELVEVQGHTDEQGGADYNLALSERRAAAVLSYLVDHGLARTRLDSHGYGLTRPIDLHHTQDAYARNRRVEFHVLQRSDM